MKIAVVGTGYVGLVTGTCFAETGNNVTCIDIDVNKVEKLKNGEITIYEPGLEKLFLRNLKEQRLHFTTDLTAGIKDAALYNNYFGTIANWAPFLAADGSFTFLFMPESSHYRFRVGLSNAPEPSRPAKKAR